MAGHLQTLVPAAPKCKTCRSRGRRAVFHPAADPRIAEGAKSPQPPRHRVANAAKGDHRPAGSPGDAAEAPGAKRRSARMARRFEDRRQKHQVRPSPEGAAQLPFVMRRRRQQPMPSRRPRSFRPMHAVAKAGKTARNHQQRAPPRHRQQLAKQQQPLRRRPAIMAENDPRAARQARNRHPQRILRAQPTQPLVGEQPLSRQMPPLRPAMA